MTYANVPQDYEAKKKRGQQAINHIEPDHIPTLIMQITWGQSYANVKLKDLLPDHKQMVEVGCSPLKDIYTDFIIGGMLTAPIMAYDFLKPDPPQYFISEDGFTMQHREISPMLPEEYKRLTADVKGYLENVILPRRYPTLNSPYPQNYEALKGAYKEVIDFMEGMLYLVEYPQKEFGIPPFFSRNAYMPMDYLMDFLRGFSGTMADMRRRPNEVKDALEALTDYVIAMTFGPGLGKGDTLFTPLHIPPFLGPKQFNEFYWPSFKKVIDHAISKGIHMLLALEGDWSQHIEKLKEFPKNNIIGAIEDTDIFWAKKAVGEHIAIIGGMSSSMLRNSTKQICIDKTKRLIDECGPGGGYIFSTDKLLMSPGDINVDNYKACVQTILTYK